MKSNIDICTSPASATSEYPKPKWKNNFNEETGSHELGALTPSSGFDGAIVKELLLEREKNKHLQLLCRKQQLKLQNHGQQTRSKIDSFSKPLLSNSAITVTRIPHSLPRLPLVLSLFAMMIFFVAHAEHLLAHKSKDSHGYIRSHRILEVESIHDQKERTKFMNFPTHSPTDSTIVRLHSKLEVEEVEPTSTEKVLNYVYIVVLISFSALFSGLTLGLMSLNKSGLEIVMEGGDESSKRAAEVIFTVRKNGNLLLCTLLLGNVAVNALLSILMADLTSGSVGFFSSTAVIVIFGEIIPQAACSRYALAIGSRAVPLVKIIIFLLYPIAAPMGLILDKALGRELNTVYNKAEMNHLLEIQAKNGAYDEEVATAMAGALEYYDKKVVEVMTPLSSTFMLSVSERLGFNTIAAIFKTGFSRIPVYENNDRNNIVGLLFVKDLIFVDPEDETKVIDFINIFGRQSIEVWVDDSLGEVLKLLKHGQSHLAVVKTIVESDTGADNTYAIKGVITLEDIIEVIIGGEIVDETDVYEDNERTKKIERSDWDDRLRLLGHKIVDETLSDPEIKAVTAYLHSDFHDTFGSLSDDSFRDLVARMPVIEIVAPDDHDSVITGDNNGSSAHPKEEILYSKGVISDTCTLILSGKIVISAGKDNFQSDAGPWSLIAATALVDSSYAPDFSACVKNATDVSSSGGQKQIVRCLRFKRDEFRKAVNSSRNEASFEKKNDNDYAKTDNIAQANLDLEDSKNYCDANTAQNDILDGTKTSSGINYASLLADPTNMATVQATTSPLGDDLGENHDIASSSELQKKKVP